MVHNFILNLRIFDIFNFANTAKIALQDEISHNVFLKLYQYVYFFKMRHETRLQSSFS